MTLADTNFWLALTLSKHEFHRTAKIWFERQTGPGSILFCRATQQSFLRLLTTDAILRPFGIPPMTNGAAWAVYDALHSDPRCGFASEPAAIEPRWRGFAERDSASPKLWMDAYLAAFATTAGHALVSIDKGFAQFKDLSAIILSPA